ncbi:MAG: hypothetical protein HY966_04555 [Ignavibacteriales bacterium]|nr:hypothetical protein [Ignavibacteriales bacterium]
MKTFFHRAAPVIVLSLAALVGLRAQSPQADVDTLIAEGDKASTKQFDNKAALEKFDQAFKLAPSNVEVLWRLSRTYVDIGEHLPATTDEEKKKQLETYEMSLDFANKAVAANPSSSMAYTRRAIASGRIGLFKGVWDALDLVKQTRVDCEKALSLDPKNASALYVMGRLHARLIEKPKIVRWPLGIGWANIEDAIKYYELAIAARPEFIMYRLDVARVYVEDDNYAKAKEHLAKIDSISKQDEDDDQFRKEAKELSEKIKDK